MLIRTIKFIPCKRKSKADPFRVCLFCRVNKGRMLGLRLCCAWQVVCYKYNRNFAL